MLVAAFGGVGGVIAVRAAPAIDKMSDDSYSCRETAIHDTADAEVIVVEYELTGTVTTTGHRASAPFVGVLRARGGKVVAWREYQDMAAIARALGQQAA